MNEGSSKIKMSKYTKKAIQSINSELVKYGYSSRVSVIDFTHFTNLYDDRYLLRFLIFGTPEYIEILDKENEKFDGYALFKKDEIKVFCNLGNKAEALIIEEESIRNRTEESLIKSSQTFNPSDWHEALINKKFGGCSIIYARKTGNDQSAVYLLMTNAIGKEDDGKNIDLTKETLNDKNLQIFLEHVFKILDKVLIDELSGNLHAIWEKTELERAQDAERSKTFDKLYHSQNEYITSILNIAEVVKKNDPELGEYVYYLGKSLSSFKDIIRYKNDDKSKITYENVSLNLLILDLEKMFNRIFRDNHLNRSIYTNIKDARINSIIEFVKKESLFQFRTTVGNEVLIPSPTGMAQLVLKEALSNAIKHTNVKNPFIKIEFTKNKNILILRIINGIFASEPDRYFMNHPEKSPRNGMKIIHELCKYLQWDIEIPIDSEKRNTIIEFKIKCNV